MKIATLRSIFKRFFPAISFSVLMVFSILVFGLNPLPKSHSNISVELYSVEDFLVPEGSIIIDMGVVPQTIKNGLKPYGLVHSLLKYHGTPVLWSINPNKVKDGIDFTVDGKGFKGGPFIVSKDYLTNDVMAVINLWVAKGVVTYKTQSAVSVPLHRELNFGMRWVINNKNSGIAEKYLENAEIPKNDYRSCYASELTSCDDIFVIPHADPDWEDFGNPLLNWNNSIASGGNSGWIWAGCQTGSNLERDVDPKNSNKRTNFLAQNPNSYPGNVDGYGLINHGDHKDASGITPYLNDFHTDPFMQFMGRTDGAHDGGSEQIYMPYPTGNWRSTTKIAAWDPNQEDVLKNKSPGKAALIAFGRAFGDSKRGMVLYEGGHELKNGSEAENVAAQRVFFNFSLEALAEKAPEIVDNTNMVSVLSGGESVQFNIQGITAGSSTATYEWSSTCSSGSFSSKSVRNPIYTAGYVSMAQECVLRLKVTDSCGRVSFKSWVVKIKPSTPEPVVRSCDCSPLYKDSNFSNPKLVSGGALCVDAVYRFSNVFPNNSHGTTIDALVRIEQFNGGASLLEIDVTSTGIPEAFQPRINSTNSSDQSVEFSITFVSGGGNYDDEVELSYFASPFDIDGDGNKTREYADISLPDAYFVSNNTLIDITQTATVVRGEARNTSTAPGGDVSEDPKYTFSSYFEKKSSLRYKIGKKDGDSDRYYSLSMSCANYQNPNSVLITQPVICGTVYDVEGNPLNNVNVNITGSDGSVKNVVTDSSGKYKTVVEIPEAFVDVVYEIRESDLNGYISVSDADGANDNLITRTINLMSSCGNDFIDGVQPEISIDGKTDILCHGTATGVINVSGTGGVEPYQFSANGGTLQSSPMFEGLPAGLYTVELIDSLGNKATANVTLSEPTNPINVVITKENAISSQGCQNGEATASVGGGTAPYTYLWSESAGNQTTETAINLPSGSHTVLITDANNCALEQGVVINCSNTCDAKIKVDKVINILCAGGTTGKTTVSASSTANAGATFTFTWNTLPAQVDAGVTSSTLNGLSAGIYTVSVTIDGTVCQPVEQSVTIVEPASVLNVSATSSDESGPETGDGTASVSATGGTAPYSYSWNPGGETLDTITGLSSGDYTVTVTDANGCTAMATVTVNPGNCKNISAMATATSATCNGQSNGTVTASVTGGSGSFTYSWSPGGATSKSITGLPAGSYTVTVTDSVTQCTVNATANVNEPSVLSSGIAISNIMCFGDSNGSLDLTVSGGTSPYQFLWNNGATTEDLNNLPAGSYSVDITDANGCTTSKTATVNQPSSGLIVSILSQDNTICNASSGSLRVEASGGTIPYSFSLNGVSQAAGEFTNLEAGDYILNVIDANGCEITQDISILVNCTDAENDINTTYVDTPVSGNVLTNDTDIEGDTQRVTSTTVTTAAGVIVTIDASTGAYTYSPPSGYIGEDRFEYTICDDGTPEACDTATVYIEVFPKGGPGNEAPVANADTAGTDKDTPVTGNVLSNDFDPDGDPIVVTTTTVTTTEGVIVTIDATTGVYTYTPPAGFTGEDRFEYTICDNGTPKLCDTAIVVITVVEDLGNSTVANDDAYTTLPGVEVFGNVLDNDTDPEGDSQTVNNTPVVDVSNGTLVLNTDGTFIYTPNAGFTGTDSFVYKVCDDGTPEACDQATVYITVVAQTPVNTTDAENDINTTYVDTPVSGNVLTNDTDIEGDTQRVTSTTVTTAAGVIVTIDASTGAYTYSPPSGYIGEDRFEYTICDDGTPEACDTATVYIEVFPKGGPGNEAPVANADTAGTDKDTPVTGNVLSNDFDPDGDPIVVTTTTVTTTEGVIVTIDATTGVYTYTPPAGFTGEDRFEYTICDNGTPKLCDTAIVVITVVEDLGNSTVANDDAYTTLPGVEVFGNVLDNDTDPEGDSQTVNNTPVVDVSNGTLVLNTDGTFIYTPNAGFTGTDSFVYKVCDDGTPEACDQATVYITVVAQTPVNTTDAENDINTTYVDTPVSGNVLTNDTDIEGDTQRVTSTTVTTAAGVIVTIDASTGAYTYSPPSGYIGEDRFEYTICDDGTPEACDTATVYIEVFPKGGPGNEAPVANADTAGTDKDTPVTGNVLSNDFDPDGDPIVVTTTTVTTTEGVIVTIDATTGVYTYTPPAGFTGEDRFEYTICDNGTPKLCDTAIVVITVVEDLGNSTVANDDAYTTLPGVEVFGNVLDNDTDPEGDSQTVNNTPVVDVSNGTLVLNTDGTFIYTPNAGFTGTDSFVYKVCDDGTPEACDQATVYITVVAQTPVNTTDAENDINTTYVDTPVSGNVLTNDTDIEGDTQRVTSTTVTTAAGVIVTIDASTGAYTYSPPSGYIGEDRFEYTICDDGTPEACDTATVYIEVFPKGGPGNEAPVANADTAGTDKDTPVTGNVLSNDFDPDGDPIVVTTTTVTTTEGVIVTIDATTGVYTYTPPAGFTGEDRFEYTICDNGTPKLCDTAIVVITVVEDLGNSTVANDDAYTTLPGVEVFGNVLDNDTDPEGDSQTVNNTPVVDVSNGTLVLNTDGTFIYTPNAGFTGTDSFVYKVCDDGTPEACDQATVYITVVAQTPVNTTDAENDINTTYVDTPVSGNVLTNDTDIEGDTQRVTSTTVTTAAGVIVTIDASTGAYTYSPPSGYIGEDRFEYTICDDGTPEACDTATVYIEVFPKGGPGNEAPVANADTAGTDKDTPVTGNVLSNDFDPDGDPIVVTTTTVTTTEGVIVTIDATTGVYTYTPPAGFTGEDRFEYTICDNGTPKLCDTAIVVITVVEDLGNSTVANDDAYTTLPGVEVSGNVLDNDTDPEGDSQTVNNTPVVDVSNGTLVLNTDGTFIYTPNAGFTGTDSFVYKVCDDGTPEACDQATVYITVVAQTPVNTTDAENDINTTYVDTPVSGNVLTNDTDIEGDTQRVTSTTVTTAAGVIVTIDASTGAYTYSPPSGYIGEDRFEYTICDDGTPEACDTATVYIEVFPKGGPGNEAPVANADTAGTDKDTPVTGNVLSNDFDPDGDPIVVTTTTVTTTEGVILTIDATTGVYTYTPPAGFTGEDRFEYTICDNGTPKLCDTAIVVITVVEDLGNSTVANDDAYTTLPGVEVFGNVLDNDTDPEGDSQTVNNTPVVDVSNGTLVLNTDGTFIYTPNAGFTGTDSFVYKVCDDGTPEACDQATVYITVVAQTPVNTTDAENDINTTYVDTPVSGNVLTNDTDIEGDTQRVTSTTVTTAAGVIVTIDASTGAYTYSPPSGYIGEDRFEYTICDDGTPEACDTATVYIEVFPKGGPGNEAPVANADTAGTDKDTPVTGNVLSNDFDPDGDPIVVTTTTVTTTEGVIVTIDATTGVYTYTPPAGFTGEDRFEYTICDNGTPKLCDTAIVVITVVEDLGNSTVANDDAYTTLPGVEVFGNVLDNDTDPEGDSQTVNNTPVVDVSNGTLVLNTDGTFIYTPNAGFTGTDSFVYKVCDDGTPEACDQATVYITVVAQTPVNTTDAENDINTTYVDTPVSGNVLTNDTDIEGDTQRVTSTTVTTAAGVIVTIDASTGAYTYSPPSGYIGEDRFEYTICDDGTPEACDTATVYIEVFPKGGPGNEAPVANADTAGTDKDTPVTGNVLSNDFDPDGDPIVVTTTTVTTTEGVIVTIDATTGVYTYTPPAGFTGEDRFEYTICDNGTPKLCDTAIVVITVVEDLGNSTVANDDAYTTLPGVEVSGNVLDNDTDPEGDSQTVNNTPVVDVSNGTLVLNTDGTFIYTPNAGFTGTDSFVYKVCDDGTPEACDQATVYITVVAQTPVNTTDAENDINTTYVDTPVSGNVLTNDTDIEGDTQRVTSTTVTTAAGVIVTIDASTGAYTYSPPSGYIGEDRFEYTICDDGTPEACDTATVYIEVFPKGGPGNEAPVANADTAGTDKDTPVTGNVLSNDFDPDGDPIVVTTTTVTTTEGVIVTIDATTGVYTYTPPAGFTGEDRFEYTICDNGTPKLCDTAIVVITVVEDLGNSTVANDDAYTTLPGVEVSGNVLDNDTDPEGDSQTVNNTPVVDVSNGTLVLNTDGTFIYTPNAGFTGTDSFVYKVCDDGTPEACDQATVYITVNFIEDPCVVNCTVLDKTIECSGLDNQALAENWNAQNIATLKDCAENSCSTDFTGEVTSDFDFANFKTTCGLSGSIDVNYTITDNNGNQTSFMVTLTFMDTIAPDILDCQIENKILSCTLSSAKVSANQWNLDNIAELESCATDGCSVDQTVTVTSNYNFDNISEGILTVIYEVSDDCDNTSTVEATLTLQNDAVVSTDISICIESEVESQVFNLFNLVDGNYNTGGTWEVVSGPGTVIDNKFFDPKSVVLTNENSFETITFSYTESESNCPTYIEASIEVNNYCKVLACNLDNVEISILITPNGDTHNEFFTVSGLVDCDFPIDVKIVNRWGAIIYKSNNYKNNWNAFTHRSSLGSAGQVPSGTYYYVVTLVNSGKAPITGLMYIGTK